MTEIFGNPDARRLPVYLVLDVSGSMAGAPIQAVNEGLRMFEQATKKDPHALESMHISIITFGGEVRQDRSMQPIEQFTPPALTAGGGTPLGSALLKVDEAIDREVVARTSERNADWKPMVFIFTDGKPTDPPGVWQDAIKKIRSREDRKLATVIAIAAGPEADEEMLAELGGIVLSMRDMNQENISELFAWISQSAATASRAGSKNEGEVELPPPPPAIKIHL